MAEDKPGAKDVDTATNVKIGESGSSPASGFSPLPAVDSESDLNSTMMAIDVSKLSLDATKTGLKLDATGKITLHDVAVDSTSSDDDEPTAKTFLKKIKHRFFTRSDDLASPRPRRFLPEKLKPLENIWIADPNSSPAGLILFYALRAFMILSCLYLEYAFYREIVRSFEIEHPARQIFVMACGAQLILILVVLIKRFSPGWLFSLPVSVLAFIMSYGALSYHTADPLYFKINEKPVSEILNGFFLISLVYALLVSVAWGARTRFFRILYGAILGLSVFAVFLNVSLGVPFEYGLLGPGFLSVIPFSYLMPLYVVLHGLIPVAFGLFAYHSLPGEESSVAKASRGFSRSLMVLFFALMVLGFSLMQKNRVFHALNLVSPKSLSVGGIENKILNQYVKIETSNFTENEGLDRKARYIFTLDKMPDKEKVSEKNKYVLKLKDAFGFPVKFLTREDLTVSTDGKPFKNYKIEEEHDPRLESGKYVLTLPLTPRQPLLEWSSERAALSPTDEFVFKLNDPSKVKRFVVRRDEDILLEGTDPKENEIRLPLNYFQPGPNKVTATLYDELDQEIFSDVATILIRAEDDFTILSPLPGDSLGETAGVLIHLKGISRDAVTGVSYAVNGQEVFAAKDMAYYHSLDLSGLPDGEAILSVKLKLADRELVHEAKIFKKTSSPELVIKAPGMGAFAERETQVAFEVAGIAEAVTSVDVLINGVPVSDVTAKDNVLTLPISRWQESEIYVVVQATLAGGQKVSDWVQLNRGLSVLSLKFDAKTLSFLNVNKVSFVLDASVSGSDNWHGKSKWHNLKNVMLAPEVESKLKNFNPSFVVFGSSKPYYFGDCSDASLLMKDGGEFSKAALKSKLDDITPKGVSALKAALGLAYKSKPEKVYVFADFADSCVENLPVAVKDIMATSADTIVTVYSLGRILEADRKQLRDTAERTGGRYYQPEDYDALVKSFLEELSLNYELHAGEKMIYQSPLDDKEFRLTSGSYRIVLPYRTDTETYEFNLEHGTRKVLLIKGVQVGGKWKIEITPEESEEM